MTVQSIFGLLFAALESSSSVEAPTAERPSSASRKQQDKTTKPASNGVASRTGTKSASADAKRTQAPSSKTASGSSVTSATSQQSSRVKRSTPERTSQVPVSSSSRKTPDRPSSAEQKQRTASNRCVFDAAGVCLTQLWRVAFLYY